MTHSSIHAAMHCMLQGGRSLQPFGECRKNPPKLVFVNFRDKNGAKHVFSVISENAAPRLPQLLVLCYSYIIEY